MNDLVARTYCVVPSAVLKALLFAGIIGGLFLGVARVLAVDVPAELIIGLIGFFFSGAILASHRLSLLRKPGLVLLFGSASIVAVVQLQGIILTLL
ncbi:MAG TPA: hypothetical protein PLE99_02720 [Candidatus Thiothrix moscowensis]|uniref:hypothetical protein n=1 Tax=unclassified Thiothrix TaxID=2636184 RepID=UPI001A2258CE|nr:MULTISPECIES: hypothetical protein [unclassified Thiothrix]MBJ6609258.1 hypothetical protein [Candidatus Thiothrix moscowensis]HRJ51655.1 hypothetical protein [Candidatus Thiothrix moscowensis]HRJ91970.1 hypothetical protein [Candidatus Thiothrix moscowensis]